jgi:SAM-dependent methyltransferase
MRWPRPLRAWSVRNRIPICNLGYKIAPSLDGYQLPPEELVDLVIGTRELSWYQFGGMFMQQAFGTLLRRHGAPFESHRTILDFGCGSGRILRWNAALTGLCEIWGCDYNPVLVDWCRQHMSELARFEVNGADPPLPFEDSKFSLVYSYSVFTHFSPERQEPWFAEMARVLQPGGMLAVTVHGVRCAYRMQFSAERLAELEQKRILVDFAERSGENICTAYHSEAFLRSLGHLGLELLDYLPGGARDASEQDLVLYRRR